MSPAISLNAFGSWEETKYPSNHRYIGSVSSVSGMAPNDTPPGWCTSTNPNCYRPNGPVNTNSYNSSSQTKDQTWMLGVGADWQAMEALKLSASYLYVKNEGETTFSSQNGYGTPLNFDNFDNSKQQYFNLKGV